MKYYTFSPEFHTRIIACKKYSTIRQKEKAKPGERFALRYWTGKPYRSKMGFLGTAVCQSVFPVIIDEPIMNGSHFMRVQLPQAFWDSPFASKYRNHFAQMEGFDDLDHMFAWFREKHGLPFTGVLTIWDPDTFMHGPPDMEFIKWFDGQSDKDWEELARITNAQLEAEE